MPYARREHDVLLKGNTRFVNHLSGFMVWKLTYTDTLGPIVRTFVFLYFMHFSLFRYKRFPHCIRANMFFGTGFFVIWQRSSFCCVEGYQKKCLMFAAAMFYDIRSLNKDLIEEHVSRIDIYDHICIILSRTKSLSAIYGSTFSGKNIPTFKYILPRWQGSSQDAAPVLPTV